ncbi:MAG: hypothetical protein CSA20_06890 [Deltaproteobacteria bacterium]|nr:MAG: hypothetical protein CSA20_06890 [Deltaproteobacteria bacterium]
MKFWLGSFITIVSFFSISNCYASHFTFLDAWQQVLQHSDVLSAQQAAVNRHRYMQKAAGWQHFPSIHISGQYTRLSDPVEADARMLEPFASMDPQVVGQTLGYMAGTGQISAQFAHDMGAFLQGIAGQDLQTTTELSPEDIYTSSIQAIWPLFTGWRVSAAEEVAAEQKKEAEAQLNVLRYNQFTALSRIYFGVVLAEQILQTRLEAEKGLQIHFEHALALEKEGQIAKVERLKAAAALDRARIETQRARHILEVSQLALTKTLHQEEEASPVSPLFINQVLPEQESFLAKTLETHPGLAILKAKQGQAKGLIRAEKGLYYPNLFAFGDYNLYKQDSILGESMPDWMVGLGFTMTLFDSGGRGEKLKAAKAAELQTRYLYSQTKRDLAVLVEKTWKEAQHALDEFDGLASSIALAEENVRLREKGFALGMSTSLDVVDARLFLESVKTQRLVAAYNYLLSFTRLLAMAGETELFAQYQSTARAVHHQMPEK